MQNVKHTARASLLMNAIFLWMMTFYSTAAEHYLLAITIELTASKDGVISIHASFLEHLMMCCFVISDR